MNRKAKRNRMAEMEEAQSSREVVRIVCSEANQPAVHLGFILGMSDTLVLLHCLQIEPFALSGYVCFPRSAVRRVERVGAPDRFLGRAVLLRGLEPVAPDGIDLTSFASVLESTAEKFPVISCWTTGRRNARCHTGHIVRVGRKRLQLREMDSEAEWLPVGGISLRRIAQVDFGGDYEQVLQLVNRAYCDTLLSFSPSVGTA